MEFTYGTETVNFTVEYSDRKTLAIGVEPPDIITVVAPVGTPDEKILQVVKAKGKWIIQKLFEIKEIEHNKYDREYVNGEAFLYLGRNYSLNIVEDMTIKQPNAKLYQGKFYIYTPTREQAQLKVAMEAWYRDKTLSKVTERIAYYQKYFNVRPSSIKVKEQKKRWASCTANRDLNFNWRCSMAPSSVLDYIVVHEMCHMIYMSHSQQFWDLVKSVLPDYEERREWLRNYGIRMEL